MAPCAIQDEARGPLFKCSRRDTPESRPPLSGMTKGPTSRPVPLLVPLAQVAEQVRVGLVLVPVKLAWKPKEVLPPGAMTLL